MTEKGKKERMTRKTPGKTAERFWGERKTNKKLEA